LTESQEFDRWVNTKNSRLWLYGIPGAGKTILSSLAIEEALEQCDKSYAVAFFYCDYKNTASQSPLNVLGSIASQLAQQSPLCFEKLKAYYESCNPESAFPTCPNEHILQKLIQEMAQSFEDVAILVDGLDECGTTTVEVVELLIGLSNTALNVKTLFASRDEVHIRDLLEDYEKISIAARSSDLKLYVASEIELRIRTKKLRLKSNELREHIMDKLVNGADGM